MEEHGKLQGRGGEGRGGGRRGVQGQGQDPGAWSVAKLALTGIALTNNVGGCAQLEVRDWALHSPKQVMRCPDTKASVSSHAPHDSQ